MAADLQGATVGDDPNPIRTSDPANAEGRDAWTIALCLSAPPVDGPFVWLWYERCGGPVLLAESRFSGNVCQELDFRRRSSLSRARPSGGPGRRYGVRSTVVTSQLPVKAWYDSIGDPALADSILDRLIHRAYEIPMEGESMRRQRTKTFPVDDRRCQLNSRPVNSRTTSKGGTQHRAKPVTLNRRLLIAVRNRILRKRCRKSAIRA